MYLSDFSVKDVYFKAFPCRSHFWSVLCIAGAKEKLLETSDCSFSHDVTILPGNFSVLCSSFEYFPVITFDCEKWKNNLTGRT